MITHALISLTSTMPAPWSSTDSGKCWVWGEFFAILQSNPKTIAPGSPIAYESALLVYYCLSKNPHGPSRLPILIVGAERLRGSGGEAMLGVFKGSRRSNRGSIPSSTNLEEVFLKVWEQELSPTGSLSYIGPIENAFESPLTGLKRDPHRNVTPAAKSTNIGGDSLIYSETNDNLLSEEERNPARSKWQKWCDFVDGFVAFVRYGFAFVGLLVIAYMVVKDNLKHSSAHPSEQPKLPAADSVTKDSIDEMLEIAQQTKEPIAEYAVGVAYLTGRDLAGRTIPENKPLAIQWLRQAATHGEVRAQSRLALLYSAEQNYSAAVKYGLLAANAGSAEAQWLLGLLHEKGLGVPLSPQTALKYYSQSAASGYADAQYSYGSMLIRGNGGSKDVPAGIEWIKSAAQQGHEAAQRVVLKYNL